MRSIAELHTHLARFDTAARSANDANEIAKRWKRIFGMDMSKESAESFARYYREMKSTRRKGQSGGGASLSPASLAAPSMGPGLYPMTYGSFPIEAGVGAGAVPSAIQSLDVYFNTAQLKGCGTEDISLHVPKDMGSNKVGGSRRHRVRRSVRGKRRATKKTLRRGRRSVRRQRGGDLLTSLTSSHAIMSSAPPSSPQSAQYNYYGGTGHVPALASPVASTWQYAAPSGSQMMSPSIVARIGAVENPFGLTSA